MCYYDPIREAKLDRAIWKMLRAQEPKGFKGSLKTFWRWLTFPRPIH